MELKVNGKSFPVEVSENNEIGMQGRDSLDGCLLFKLKKGFHSFWMKDCVIPLDIVFVINNRINKVFSNCQPCDSDDCQNYKAAADKVYEFPAGTCDGWKPGDMMNLYLGAKTNPV